MGKDLIASSTTDSEQDVNAAIVDVAATEKPAAKVEEKPAAKVEEKPAAKVEDTPIDEVVLEADEPKSWAKLPPKELTQKRIDRLTWQREEEKRQRAASETKLQQEIDALKAQVGEKPAAKAEEKPAAEDQEPKEEDYATYVEFLRALTRYETRKAVQESTKTVVEKVRDENANTTAERAYLEAGEKHRGRVETFKKDHDDFDVVIKNPHAQVSGAMEAAILASDQGPAIQYYLGQHPEESVEMTALTLRMDASAVPLVRRLLESKLPAPKETPAQAAVETKTSEAPAPIEPVGGRPTVGQKTLDEMSLDEFKAKRNKDERARLKGQR